MHLILRMVFQIYHSGKVILLVGLTYTRRANIAVLSVLHRHLAVKTHRAVLDMHGVRHVSLLRRTWNILCLIKLVTKCLRDHTMLVATVILLASILRAHHLLMQAIEVTHLTLQFWIRLLAKIVLICTRHLNFVFFTHVASWGGLLMIHRGHKCRRFAGIQARRRASIEFRLRWATHVRLDQYWCLVAACWLLAIMPLPLLILFHSACASCPVRLAHDMTGAHILLCLCHTLHTTWCYGIFGSLRRHSSFEWSNHGFLIRGTLEQQGSFLLARSGSFLEIFVQYGFERGLFDYLSFRLRRWAWYLHCHWHSWFFIHTHLSVLELFGAALYLLEFITVALGLPPPRWDHLLVSKALAKFLIFLILSFFICSLLLLVKDGQVDDLLAQISFFYWIWRRGVVSLPLEPEKVLVVILIVNRPLVAQVFEPR